MSCPYFPYSPLSLVQEKYRCEPWKMLVGCVLLNQTGHVQARPVLERLFARWPTPEAMASADPSELAGVLRPCGLQNRRASALIRLSASYGRVPVADLHGIGRYALDSWSLFQLSEVPVAGVTDKELRRYVAWLVEAGLHTGYVERDDQHP